MTMSPNGEANCDRCGVDLGNAAIDKCVVISALVGDGARVETYHLCVKGVEGGQGCASKALNRTHLAWYVENVSEEGNLPELFNDEETPAT